MDIGKYLIGDGPDPPARNELFYRERAEQIAREQFARWPENEGVATREQALQILHELRVHQIEIELQNEELRGRHVELDAARARYRALYDLAPVGYLTVDAQELILEANLTAARLLGVARSEIINQRLPLFVSEEDRRIYYLFNKALIETGQPQVCELRMISADHRVFWARLEANTDAEVKVNSVIRVTISDISENKRAEEERQYHQAELVQSQKMEAMGQLAGGIAHDFNNILGAMIMQLDLIKLTPSIAPDTLTNLIDELLEIAHRGSKLPRQLLLFSGRHPIKTSRHDANVIVLDLTKQLERLLGEAINLVVERWEEPLWVDVDTGMIEQVVINLSVNSRDAMPEGGRLSIGITPVTLDAEKTKRKSAAQLGPFVCVRVSDTGCGIDPEVMDRIFEPFFTTKTREKGSGLGLAMVEGIVAKHRGFVEVESWPGKGTTFRVYLPRVAPPPITVPRHDEAIARRGHERILVVEDEAAVRLVAVRGLSHLGYRVSEAANGVEALKIWEQEGGGFDLLFTDAVMPGGLSGLELCSRLKEQKRELKAIVTSGYSPEIVDDMNFAKQEVTFLPKPYNVLMLAATVRACLEGDSQH
jgi:two-component system, cell cycle sensor histidine kinase and response regulator CckA